MSSSFRRKHFEFLVFEIDNCLFESNNFLLKRMTSTDEYRSVIKFCLNLRNIESAEIIQQLQEAYKERSAPSTAYKSISCSKIAACPSMTTRRKENMLKFLMERRLV